MNRIPVSCENSDDIHLESYLKDSNSNTVVTLNNSNTHREDPSLSNKPRNCVNGIANRNNVNKNPIAIRDSSLHHCESIKKRDTKTPSHSAEDLDKMDQPLTSGGHYRHYPPADEAGGDSSDMLNSSSVGDDQLSRRRLVTNNSLNLHDSDIDNEGPEGEDDDDGNDLSSVYHLRRQQRRQQRLRRRETSSSACGDTASRRRPPISLSRSSTRVGQSIPPPPSEPPPSLPPCGIDLSSQYSMYPILGPGGFNLAGQQVTASPPTMLPMAGLSLNYMTPGGIMNPADGNQQLLQMQQAALLHQQQHQQQQQQQQLHQRLVSANAVAAMGVAGNPYLQGFATVGRPVRTSSLNHPQMTLPHHQPLQELGLISSAALIQAHAAAQAQAQANATQSAGGSGSVVYENSYNSFQRLPPGSCMGQLPSTVSQDLLSASAGGATNADDSIRLGDNQNSTPSTTNGGGGVGGVAEPLAKSPSVAAMVSANSPSALVTSPLMNFYETAGGSTGGTYVTHPANLGAMVNVQRVGKPGSPGATGSPSGARSFWRCSWQYWVILICVLAFLLAVSFAVFFSDSHMQASSDDGFNLHIDHSTEIIGHVSALFKSKDYSDISLVVGGTQFLAHRVILASRCDYFRALLFGGLSETHSSTIHLNGINSTAFYHVLGYIYTGRLDISGLTIGDALDILGLVCQYNFPNLENALSAHFVRSLTPNNVCQIYDAAITYDLDDLIDACLQTIDRAPATVLAHPQFLRLSRASVIRMLSRDSFYIPEVAVLHAVQAWLDADYQARLSKFATLCAPSSSLSVSVSSPLGHDEQQQLKYPTLAANAVLSAPPTLPPVGRKHPLVPGTRSNSSESLFSSASTSDSVASCGTKSKVNDNGQSALEELRTQFERETADIRVELVGCIRFELMSLSELSTEVRASRLLSPDDLLDKISAKTQLISNQLPIRGRLLPEVNLAVPRLGCSLLKGQWGNYPFFFVDNGDPLSAADQSLQTSGRRDRYHQSRSIWDASCDWMATSSRPYDREVQLRGRGDALANASAWGFMENVAISTPAADSQSGPSGASMHLSSWLPNSGLDPKLDSAAVASSVAALHPRRTSIEPPPESDLSVVSHLIGVRGEEIVIDLGHCSFVNLISMQLWDREPRSYSYYVEVCQSLDEGLWHRVVDYSNYTCRSWQTLYFSARIIRFIRIVGTRSSVGKYFHLITFQCLYTREKFAVQRDLLIPRTNVATIQHGATVLEGVSRLRNSLIDGDVSVYNLNYGFTCHQLGNGSIDVQLSQPFLVSSIRFLLWDLDSRAYSYIVEISQDRLSWSLIFDASQLLCRSWQTIKFPLQPVTFIRITGTGNTANDVFHIVHLECPATTINSDSGTSDFFPAGEVRFSGLQQVSPQPSQPQNAPTAAGRGSSTDHPVFTDTVSALRHQRPRLLEVEAPSTPSSSLVADLSTFSLHSEATLDATGMDAGGQSLEFGPSMSLHQRRRRRRGNRSNHEQVAPNGSVNGDGIASSSLHCFSCNSRTTSLSSVTRNDCDAHLLTSLNSGERGNQFDLLLRGSSDSSLSSSANNPSEQSR